MIFIPELLDADNNLLTGTIPDEIYKMKKLRILALANNDLSGSLSSFIGQLDSLIRFDVSSNKINGTIPEEIQNMQNPVEIILRDNDFSGTIPPIENVENLSK